MLRRFVYFLTISVAVLCTSCTAESLDEFQAPTVANIIEMEQEMLGLVNSHREAQGFPVLQFSAVAYQYASEHTDYMIAKGSLSHDHFSARASGISSEVQAEYVAENVAKDYNTAGEAFDNWLSSPNHRKTMEGDFSHTAVSVKKDGTGNFYYTQLFFR